jgi:hypothetical protein
MPEEIKINRIGGKLNIKEIHCEKGMAEREERKKKSKIYHKGIYKKEG